MLILLLPLAYYWFQESEIYRDRRILSIERDILYSWLKDEKIAKLQDYEIDPHSE